MVDRGNSQRWANVLNQVVDDRVKNQAPIERRSYLPEDFVPSTWSVLCGRERRCYESPGNRRFRVLVDIYLPKFIAAKSRADKSMIVMDVVDTIRAGSMNRGGFIKFDAENNRWFEVGDAIAREKVGNEFRVAKAAAAGLPKKKTPPRPRRSKKRYVTKREISAPEVIASQSLTIDPVQSQDALLPERMEEVSVEALEQIISGIQMPVRKSIVREVSMDSKDFKTTEAQSSTDKIDPIYPEQPFQQSTVPASVKFPTVALSFQSNFDLEELGSVASFDLGFDGDIHSIVEIDSCERDYVFDESAFPVGMAIEMV